MNQENQSNFREKDKGSLCTIGYEMMISFSLLPFFFKNTK